MFSTAAMRPSRSEDMPTSSGAARGSGAVAGAASARNGEYTAMAIEKSATSCVFIGASVLRSMRLASGARERPRHDRQGRPCGPYGTASQFAAGRFSAAIDAFADTILLLVAS